MATVQLRIRWAGKGTDARVLRAVQELESLGGTNIRTGEAPFTRSDIALAEVPDEVTQGDLDRIQEKMGGRNVVPLALLNLVNVPL